MSKTHGGKGSARRPTMISRAEESLRWELIKPDITPERHAEIMKKIQEIMQRNAEDAVTKALGV